MYQVIIADDEPLIRESLFMSIDWEALGCTVCLQAKNVIDIVNYIDENNVDIILLDINMPGVDGLTFARNLRTMEYECKIIIVSAYKEFQYVKEALKVGASDYIAKPIRTEEMEMVLNRVVEEINNERKEIQKQEFVKQENEYLTQYLEQSKQLVENNILINALEGTIGVLHMNDIINIIPSETGRFAIIIIKIIGEIDLKLEIKKRMFDYFKDRSYLGHYLIKTAIYDENIVLFMFMHESQEENNCEKYLKNIFLQVYETPEIKQNKIQCILGISRIMEIGTDIRSVYNESLDKLNYHFFSASHKTENTNKNYVYHYSFIADLNLFLNRFTNHSLSDENWNVTEEVEKLFDTMTEYCGTDVQLAKTLISDICVNIIRSCSSETSAIEEEYTIENVVKLVNNINTIFEGKDYVMELIERSRDDKSIKYDSPIIEAALEYIRLNYRENISLTMLADELHVNASYLSRLFKLKLKKNFGEIVARERINMAKQLLKDPRIRLNEVAVMSGYKEYAYFYQVFKKIEGVTPMEYRTGKNN